MINEIIVVYALVDDLLKTIGHKDDIRSHMSDAEVITSGIVSAMFFGGNHFLACCYLKEHNLVPTMLGKSRFNRRLHRLSMLMNDLFHQLGMVFKEINSATEYLLDSFPNAQARRKAVAICDNIRIFDVNLINSEDYRGYISCFTSKSFD